MQYVLFLRNERVTTNRGGVPFFSCSFSHLADLKVKRCSGLDRVHCHVQGCNHSRTCESGKVPKAESRRNAVDK